MAFTSCNTVRDIYEKMLATSSVVWMWRTLTSPKNSQSWRATAYTKYKGPNLSSCVWVQGRVLRKDLNYARQNLWNLTFSMKITINSKSSRILERLTLFIPGVMRKTKKIWFKIWSLKQSILKSLLAMEISPNVLKRGRYLLRWKSI